MSKNRIVISFLVLLAAALSLACDNAAAPRPVSGSATTVDKKPAANEQAIKDAQDVPIAKLNGGTIKLADYRGKVLVVDFWATYCPPCVKQAPQLAALNERYRDRGLVVVGLTSDPKEDQQKVEEFIKKAGINYTIGYDNSWLSGAFLKGTEDDSGQPPIPQLFVLARDGRVVEHLIGEQPGRMQYLEKVVNEQLGASR
jgi:peroxiredoxin